MSPEHHGIDLLPVITLLAVAVVAAPVFKRLGLGAVLGYLAGGLAIGPFGLRVFTEPAAILQVAELGVVMFLFVIGLEMRPSRLWQMRRQIFGLGFAQVAVCAALLTVVGLATGFPVAPSFVAGAGFVLTSTAIVMQLLEERGELASDGGQRIVAILLLEDLMIVPLLAIVAFLAPIAPGHAEAHHGLNWSAIGVGAGAIAGLILAGRYLLNPLFGFLADSRARDVMTAAALLVVLGAAYAMERGGLSMAMGAFVAGVLLSESSYRHQLEVDVEPFRGVLLGLFFVAVGMSLRVDVVAANWGLILGYVLAYMAVKAAAIYLVARLFRAPHREATERAVFMAQGGEFAFVLYTTATAGGLLSAELNAMFTATVITSMVLTPFSTMALKFLPKPLQSLDGVEKPEGLTGNVLLIGFGRFGQIASQPLIAKGQHTISIIDNDVEMIQVAQTFGFKIYYGDGTRLDILHAAGAGTADLILVCVDKKEAATRIVELVKSQFPLAKVFARSFDRGHSLELVKAGVDYQLREVFESALEFGAETLRELGADVVEVGEIIEAVRERDRQRFAAQMVGGLMAGRDLLRSNAEDQARESGTVAGPSEPIMVPEGEQAKV